MPPAGQSIVIEAFAMGTLVGKGRYEIKARLGQGSMGYVFRAWDTHLQTEVVIKVPTAARLEDEEFRTRFERESQFLVKLNHPQIVKVMDIGEHHQIPYFVMQFIDGGSLKEKMLGSDRKVRPMPFSSLEQWLLDVAKALDFVHKQGYLHRDVKPANILFDKHGHAYLSDFGLSKIMHKEEDSNGSMTATGAVVGTPNYVAPEVVLGTKYDGRADLYSLATTVYEVLAGKVPLEGPTASATMVNQTTKQPPPLSNTRPEASRELSQVLHKALAKRPETRFNTCIEFAEAILNTISPNTPGKSASQSSTTTASAATSVASGAAPVVHWIVKGTKRGKKGEVPCPACQKIIKLQPKFAGKRGSCAGCGEKLLISENLNELRWVQLSDSAGSQISGVTASEINRSSGGEFDAILGQEVFGLKISPRVAVGLAATLMLVLLALAVHFGRESNKPADRPKVTQGDRENREKSQQQNVVQLIDLSVYATNGANSWCEDLLTIFKQRIQARNIAVNPIAMDFIQLSGVLSDPQAKRPLLWFPQDNFELTRFNASFHPTPENTNPIVKEIPIMHSPLVAVVWKSREVELRKKYPEQLTLSNLIEANQKGWAKLAEKPEWGRFRYTVLLPGTPEKVVNSTPGVLLPWLSLAYANAEKKTDLAISDVENAAFRTKILQSVTQSQTIPINHKSGFEGLMEWVVEKGPTETGDVFLVPEHIARKYQLQLASKWEPVELLPLYPLVGWKRSMCITDHPDHAKPEIQQAMQVLEDFLKDPHTAGLLEGQSGSQGWRMVNASSETPPANTGSPATAITPEDYAPIPTPEVFSSLEQQVRLFVNGGN